MVLVCLLKFLSDYDLVDSTNFEELTDLPTETATLPVNVLM